MLVFISGLLKCSLNNGFWIQYNIFFVFNVHENSAMTYRQNLCELFHSHLTANNKDKKVSRSHDLESREQERYNNDILSPSLCKSKVISEPLWSHHLYCLQVSSSFFFSGLNQKKIQCFFFYARLWSALHSQWRLGASSHQEGPLRMKERKEDTQISTSTLNRSLVR